MDARPVKLEVFSDLACPWCYIGRRRLGRALAGEPEGAVELRWRAFELQPDLPAEGVDGPTFYARKFGSESRREAIFARVTSAGAEDGIRFDFPGMRRAPNTRLAHRIIQLAGRSNAGDVAALALFGAHFEDGADVSNLDQALDALQRRGVPIDAGDLRAQLAEGEGLPEVLADEEEAQTLGIGGVPLYLADRTYALSGAQPPEEFTRLLAAVRSARGLDRGPSR